MKDYLIIFKVEIKVFLILKFKFDLQIKNSIKKNLIQIILK